jgi:hypothetical protein
MNDAKIELLLSHVPKAHIPTTINTLNEYEPPEGEGERRQELLMLVEYGVKEVRGFITAMESGFLATIRNDEILAQRHRSLAYLEAAQHLVNGGLFH